MVFKCQQNSFLKEFTTKVVSCEPAILDWTPTGANEAQQLHGYNVVCEDTILFPEGGGQPCDYGTINGHPVRSVVRRRGEAVHFVDTDKSFEQGMEVTQRLDWERRLDHMQQHSGQHLITELFDCELNYNTTSWWLGSETSYIELDATNVISRESLDAIEGKANELIREARAVAIVLIDPHSSSEFVGVRAPRGVPKEVEGPVRVVRIAGQRDNMCCGTHVSNLAQLQSIKLLYSEKVKGKIYVHFVVGQRVLRRLGQCFEREQQLNSALRGGPHQHLELVQKLQSNLKITKKSLQRLLKDFAMIEADKLGNSPGPLPKYYTLHRKDGIEPDFISTFLRHAPKDITLYFLTVSEVDSNKGHMVLRGDPDLVQHFGPRFLQLLDGKGSGKGDGFQGKINNANKVPQCEALLEEHFNNIAGSRTTNPFD